MQQQHLSRDAADALIEIRGLNIRRPDGATLFSELNLELYPGEVVVVLGPSGAGKSTLMHALHGREGLLA
ncbi:MAG: ATP-binding cassette domain-containing protein, partial [Nannocystaceae bacterium]